MRISLPTHGVLELLLGLALLALAVMLQPAGLLIACFAGIVIVGLALAGTQTLPVSTHHALDQAVAAVLLGCALGLAIDGHPGATVVLGAAAVLELALVNRTRWTRR